MSAEECFVELVPNLTQRKIQHEMLVDNRLSRGQCKSRGDEYPHGN